MSASGSETVLQTAKCDFRSSPDSGHRQAVSSAPKATAGLGGQGIPNRCADYSADAGVGRPPERIKNRSIGAKLFSPKITKHFIACLTAMELGEVALEDI